MAFCNSCGTTLQPGAKFCSKCGATLPIAMPGVPTATTSAPPTPGQSNNAVKIVLIIVAVLVGLGIIGAATTGFVAWRLAHGTHVETSDGKVRVETPLGTVVSSDDSEDAIKRLGVDVYPNARVLKGSAATIAAGNVHTVAAEFESDDPPERVADFYKSKLPHANVTVSDEKNFSIVSTEGHSFVTVNIEAEDGKTKIHIANVSGKGTAGASSSGESN